MTHVADLQIATEILPLFDYTCSIHSKEQLLYLLTTLPSSLKEVQYRQDIIKGLIANRATLGTFSYSRIDMNEVYAFLGSIQHKADTAHTHTSGNWQMRLPLMVSQAERQRLTASINQVIGLFYRLQTYYFSKLQATDFPQEFRQLPGRIYNFLLQLKLEQYEESARNGTLKAKQVQAMLHTLEALAATGAMRSFWKDLFLFEAYLSAAIGILKHCFQFPGFANGGINIAGLYHPLVKNVVKNDLHTESNVVLLTGPNMSGKSTLLKSISLCVYLAHAGLAVPAEACSIPFFETISVAINSSDDIKNGYSHFLNEVMTLKQVVTEAHGGRGCFAVFDELFKGTNVEDALSITKTTIAGLTKWSNSYFFISTHLHQLKEFMLAPGRKADCYFIECNLEERRPVFTYRLQKGWSDLKIGRLLFDQEGLSLLLE